MEQREHQLASFQNKTRITQGWFLILGILFVSMTQRAPHISWPTR